MKNCSNVIIVIQTHIKAGKNNEFIEWNKRLCNVVEKFPGYVSQIILPPNQLQHDWTIIQKFTSKQSAKEWLQSSQRHKLLEEIGSILEGVDNIYLYEEKESDQGAVTAAISSIISPEDENKFLDWQGRIAQVQSKFPGFIGYRLEKPKPGMQDDWISIVAFDSNEHLEGWLSSPERKRMLEELNTFSSKTNIQKIHSGFDFWFDRKSSTGTAWKENMLVLLTLYPIVFLLSYIQNPIIKHGIPFWLALFFGNAVSVIILGWITTPFFMKIFSWWLKPKEGLERKYNFLGTLIIISLYILSLLICFLLSNYI